MAYPAYGEPHSKKTELDHLVSLELGGANDAANLWPEYPPTPNPKDKVENALHAAVCDGKVTLKAAQNAIAVQLGDRRAQTSASADPAPGRLSRPGRRPPRRASRRPAARLRCRS